LDLNPLPTVQLWLILLLGRKRCIREQTFVVALSKANERSDQKKKEKTKTKTQTKQKGIKRTKEPKMITRVTREDINRKGVVQSQR
jgi:hypothetical protein